MAEEELEKKEFDVLVSKSYAYIKKYVSDHPYLLYKGLPLIVAIYVLYPLIFTVWEWLPWIWSSYEICRKISPKILLKGLKFLT
uniref:Transmembrane protein n=1 Tax=Marseillevirus LCMAC102 TaxID=2506603 RepID=A0A481YTK7_9VIRU|nr:MAG: uncharacterized protein LCMAC102_02040 [Marseillevirus LCMAC102]